MALAHDKSDVPEYQVRVRAGDFKGVGGGLRFYFGQRMSRWPRLIATDDPNVGASIAV